MKSSHFPVSWIITWLVSGSLARVFEPCDLADELLRLGAPQEQISTWVCIAQHESDYNTSALGPPNWDGSRDHGIFQINDRYWCSPPGSACGVDCRSLENDDIADDWKCVKRIFKATRLQEGNGFRAWAVYGPHCSGDTSRYTKGCKVRSAYVNQLVPSHDWATSHALVIPYANPFLHYGLPSYVPTPGYGLSVYSAHLPHHPVWYSHNFIDTHRLNWNRCPNCILRH